MDNRMDLMEYTTVYVMIMMFILVGVKEDALGYIVMSLFVAMMTFISHAVKSQQSLTAINMSILAGLSGMGILTIITIIIPH